VCVFVGVGFVMEFFNVDGDLFSEVVTISGREMCDRFRLQVQVSSTSFLCGCVCCILGLSLKVLTRYS